MTRDILKLGPLNQYQNPNGKVYYSRRVDWADVRDGANTIFITATTKKGVAKELAKLKKELRRPS